MATNPKFLKMIESLRQATISGHVEWSQPGLPGYFSLRLKQGTITVSTDDDGDGERYYVGLNGEKGRMIESEMFENGDEGFEAARDLYEIARRSALNVDKILDSVISDLEKSLRE